MKKRIFTISGFLFLFVVSCSPVEEVRIGPATGVEINGFSGKQVNFKVMVNIENPNRQSFTLYRIMLMSPHLANGGLLWHQPKK